MKNTLAKLCAWDGTRPRRAHPLWTPAKYGIVYEDVQFPSAHPDSALLSGWLLPAPRETGRGIVILCHGHTSTRFSMLAKAVALRRHHFTTLVFDFRARGRSGGNFCALGSRETEDVLGAVAFLRQRENTKRLPIGALGESMGGAAVIQAAARCNDIRAVVTEAAFASLDAALRQRMRLFFGPFAEPVIGECQRIGNETFDIRITEIAPVEVVDAISPRPFLLIQDGLDPTCPRRESERLFAAASEPKERWIVPAAYHCGAFAVARREYTERVVRFFHEGLHAETDNRRFQP